jgi:hypothetical protein
MPGATAPGIKERPTMQILEVLGIGVAAAFVIALATAPLTLALEKRRGNKERG